MRRPFSGGEGARGRTRAVLAVGVLALCAVGAWRHGIESPLSSFKLSLPHALTQRCAPMTSSLISRCAVRRARSARARRAVRRARSSPRALTARPSRPSQQPAGSAAPRAPSSGAAAEVEVSSPGAASSRGKYALGSEHQPKLVVQLCTS